MTINYRLAFAFTFVICVALQLSARAQDGMADFEFAGLWMSVDHVDGAPALLSITPQLDADGYMLVTSTAAFSLCDAPTHAGHAIATGVVEDGELSASDRVIHCEDGSQRPAPVRIVPHAEHHTIAVIHFANDVRPPVMIHRISASAR